MPIKRLTPRNFKITHDVRGANKKGNYAEINGIHLDQSENAAITLNVSGEGTVRITILNDADSENYRK